MEGNDFKFTHTDVFRDLPALSRLELHNNKIDLIPDTAFDGCTSLNWLCVTSSNHLLFPPSDFHTLLYFRALSDNNIARLMVTHFEDNPLTSRLYLHNNDLSYIEDGTFDHIGSIGYL